MIDFQERARAVVAFGGAHVACSIATRDGERFGLDLSQRCGSSHRLASSTPIVAVDSSFALSLAAV